MGLIINGGKRVFPSKKRNRLPITNHILEKINEEEPLTVEDLNVDTAFKVTWAGFMRMGELTYTAAELKKDSFKETKLTRSDILFAECCNVTLAWWYVHVSDICISLCFASEPLFMHCILSLYLIRCTGSCLHAEIHSFMRCTHLALHLFLRYIHLCTCILSLFSCISHKAWSPPDLFFSLTCIKSQTSWPECSAILSQDERTAPRSGDASRCV